jgi:hypothetical protein
LSKTAVPTCRYGHNGRRKCRVRGGKCGSQDGTPRAKFVGLRAYWQQGVRERIRKVLQRSHILAGGRYCTAARCSSVLRGLESDVSQIRAPTPRAALRMGVHRPRLAPQQRLSANGTTSQAYHGTVLYCTVPRATQSVSSRRVTRLPATAHRVAPCLWNIMLPWNRVLTSSMSIFQTSCEHALVVLTVCAWRAVYCT